MMIQIKNILKEMEMIALWRELLHVPMSFIIMNNLS